MKKKFLALVVVCAVMLLVCASAHAQSMQPWVGTWKLNVAKSTYNPGPRPSVPPTMNTTKLEIVNGVMRITTDAVNAQGQASHVVRMAIFDGKEHGAEGNTNTYVYRWVDPRHYEWTQKAMTPTGVVVTTTHLELSADGKTQTLTGEGRNAQGQVTHNTTIYERQ